VVTGGGSGAAAVLVAGAVTVSLGTTGAAPLPAVPAGGVGLVDVSLGADVGGVPPCPPPPVAVTSSDPAEVSDAQPAKASSSAKVALLEGVWRSETSDMCGA
jgi:hypothetical protein